MNAKKTRLALAFIMMAILMVQLSIVSNAGSISQNPTMFKGKLVINGKTVGATNMLNPAVVLNGYVYYPVSGNDLSLLGLAIASESDNETVLMKSSPSSLTDYGNSSGYIGRAYYANIHKLKLGSKTVSGAGSNGPALIRVGAKLYFPITNKSVLKSLKLYASYNGGDLVIDTRGSEYVNNGVYTSGTKSNRVLSKLISSVNRGVSRTRSIKLANSIDKASDKYGISKYWIAAIVWKESTFRSTASSGSGAVGLMQMMVTTGKLLGYTKADLMNPDKNVDICVKYLKRLKDSYNGDIKKATLAYNQGSLRVNRGLATRGYLSNVEKKYRYILTYVKKH
jgi:soluble lytic murein transglycosylase-like protein